MVQDADRLFVIGTTLATYSAFRYVSFSCYQRYFILIYLPPYGSPYSLLKHALELRKPVLHLNVGPTRADGLPGVDKLEIPTSAVMTDVVHAVV